MSKNSSAPVAAPLARTDAGARTLPDLFREYAAQDTSVANAKAALEAQLASRSEVVREIFNTNGKGPFRYRGSELTIVQRGETFYFRGKTDKSAVIEVEE